MSKPRRDFYGYNDRSESVFAAKNAKDAKRLTN